MLNFRWLGQVSAAIIVAIFVLSSVAQAEVLPKVASLLNGGCWALETNYDGKWHPSGEAPVSAAAVYDRINDIFSPGGAAHVETINGTNFIYVLAEFRYHRVRCPPPTTQVGILAPRPVEYVKVCSLYGAGFYYLPGTNRCIKIGGPTTLILEGGFSRQSSTFLITGARSGSLFGSPIPITNDPIMPFTAGTGGTGFIGGVQSSWRLIELSPPSSSRPTEQLMYAPADKSASGFPAVLPTKAPPKPAAPPPLISFNVEAGIYGFAGGTSTINGIPGGPGITPTGSDSFNFRDNFMVTAGGAIVVPVKASLTVALTGGFAGVDKTVTFNCVTYCENGVPVPTFSAAKDVFLPGAYVGGRVQWPIAIPGLPGTSFVLQYRHVFAFGENVSLGSVAQGRIVGFNVAQDLDLVTAGVSIPLH